MNWENPIQASWKGQQMFGFFSHMYSPKYSPPPPAVHLHAVTLSSVLIKCSNSVMCEILSGVRHSLKQSLKGKFSPVNHWCLRAEPALGVPSVPPAGTGVAPAPALLVAAMGRGRCRSWAWSCSPLNHQFSALCKPPRTAGLPTWMSGGSLGQDKNPLSPFPTPGLPFVPL